MQQKSMREERRGRRARASPYLIFNNSKSTEEEDGQKEREVRRESVIRWKPEYLEEETYTGISSLQP